MAETNTSKSHDENTHEHGKFSSWLWLLLVIVIGVVFIWIGNAMVNEQLLGWNKILPKVLIDFGIALVVASVVAGTFDLAFHRAVFGRPIENIEKKTAVLTDSVEKNVKEMSEAIEILQTVNYFHIHAIKERKTEYQKEVWKLNAEKLINDSRTFIYIMGRTMDELFSRKGRLEPNVISILKQKLGQDGFEAIKFIVADVYSENSVYVNELRLRDKRERRELMERGKDTSELLLELKHSEGKRKAKLDVKLSNEYIPFMMIMNEDTLMVQSYIPFEDGYDGIVIEIKKSKELLMEDYGLHDIYKDSYDKLFEKIKDPKVVLQLYAERKQTDLEELSRLEELFNVMGINGFKV